MAKDIRSLSRYNESTEQTEIFYPATTTDAIADRTRQKSLADILKDLEDNSGAYDISAANASGTPPVLAKYADLAAALGTNGANVPVNIRKGGMSVKFVQTSDHKYVQYRYMGTATTGTPNPFLDTANWQGVDDVPTEDSKNLVISSGVYSGLSNIQTEIDGKTKKEVTFTESYTDYYVSIEEATTISYTVKNLNNFDAYIGIRFVDDNDNIIVSVGNPLIAIGGTYVNGASISQVTGATKIKFVKVYGNSFEIIVNTDNSINARVSKNANDIASLTLREESFEQSTVAKFTQTNNELLHVSHLISDIEIPTDKFGYINANGAINSQTSGTAHRTDYTPVGLGYKIHYKGYYSSGDFSAIYGYNANKEPVEQLLATGNRNEVIEITNSNIKYIVAWGDVSTHELEVTILAKYNLKKIGGYEIVDAKGNGDYLTLEDAIWGNISDRNDASKHRTIIVMPGVYIMNTYYGNTDRFWKVISNRNLSIIGIDRNACILKNTKGKYIAGSNRIDDACLKLSGNVLIKNLTILASHENFDGTEGSSPLAYCIHLDSGGADCNLEIDNCIMSNKQSACVGIGTADNYTIQIRNCKLVTDVDNPSSYTSWSGAIICHNTDYSNPATLRLENNIMKSNTPNTLSIVRSSSYTSPIKLEAYRNIIGGNVSIDSGIVTLDDLCYGNNKSELNYQ